MRHLTKSHKDAIRKANKGRQFRLGTHQSKETKEKIRLKNTGQKRTKAFCKNISLKLKGRRLTKEHKLKIKKSQHNHHIDLDKKNNKKSNKLKLTPSIHQKLHTRAYRYLVKIGKIKDYLKWFKRNFGGL